MTHTVIITPHDEPLYAEKGWRRTAKSPRDLISAFAWSLLDEQSRAELIVMEIDEEEHAKQNAPPQAERLILKEERFLSYARIERVDVMERGEWKSVVARSVSPEAPVGAHAQVSGGAVECYSADLFETKRGAVQAARADVDEAIRQHRMAIARLEDFLKEHEPS